LAIIRMVLREPQIVFMDEPTSNMDQGTESRVINFIGKWIEGRTLVVSTHRPQLLSWAHEVALIESGKCAASGPTQEMLERLEKGISVKAARNTAIEN
jgi:ATP-binding cassette subfamily C protein LapB